MFFVESELEDAKCTSAIQTAGHSTDNKARHRMLSHIGDEISMPPLKKTAFEIWAQLQKEHTERTKCKKFQMNTELRAMDVGAHTILPPKKSSGWTCVQPVTLSAMFDRANAHGYVLLYTMKVIDDMYIHRTVYKLEVSTCSKAILTWLICNPWALQRKDMLQPSFSDPNLSLHATWSGQSSAGIKASNQMDISVVFSNTVQIDQNINHK